jgi:hypothetical protein
VNVLKQELFVKNKKAPMITDSNQVCFAKMLGCGVQEEVLLSSPSRQLQGHFDAFTYKPW